MNDETLPPDLWQQTRRAVEAWGHGAVPGNSPSGQVLVLPQVGDPRVAWAALRRDTKPCERRLLIAADTNPLTGSGDVAVTGPTTGPLTLRCRFAAWVDERELSGATLLGILTPEALARAESRRQAVEEGLAAGTFSERETEDDPQYQDWIEDVVRPALGKLAAQVDAAAQDPRPAIPFSVTPPTPLRPVRNRAWIRWAAVLAFVALGTGSGILWWQQEQEIAGLRASAETIEASHREAIAELEARRAGLEAQYRARLREAGEDWKRLESEHRAQLAALEAELARLREATVVRNPLLASLDPDGAVRGQTRLRVGPEVSHLVLILRVDDPAGTEFRILIDERRSGKRTFAQEGLRADALGEVRLGLPAAVMPPGSYRLRLFAKAGGNLRLTREHRIDIEEAIPRRPAPW